MIKLYFVIYMMWFNKRVDRAHLIKLLTIAYYSSLSYYDSHIFINMLPDILLTEN